MLELDSSCVIKLKVIIKDIKFIKVFVKIGLLWDICFIKIKILNW